MADDDHDDGDLDLSMLQADDGDEENAAPAEGEDAGELDFDEAFMAAFQGEGAEAMEGEGLQDQDLMYDSQALDQEEGGLPDVGDEEPAATQGEGGEAGQYMDDEQEEDLDDDRGHEGGETEEAEEAEALQGIGSMSSKDTEDALRKARIMAALTEEQLNRYEAFRRAALARPKMKRFVSALLGVQVSDKTVIALCGIGKMFVGDLIEMARHMAVLEGHTGPLLPRHITRAYQQLDIAAKVPHGPSSKPRSRLFR